MSNIKVFFQELIGKLFTIFQSKVENITDEEIFKALDVNEEDKESLQNIFKEIDEYHDIHKEYKESGKNIDEFLGDKVIKWTLEENPNATQEDIDNNIQLINNKIGKGIEQECEQLEQGYVETKEPKQDNSQIIKSDDDDRDR